MSGITSSTLNLKNYPVLPSDKTNSANNKHSNSQEVKKSHPITHREVQTTPHESLVPLLVSITGVLFAEIFFKPYLWPSLQTSYQCWNAPTVIASGNYLLTGTSSNFSSEAMSAARKVHDLSQYVDSLKKLPLECLNQRFASNFPLFQSLNKQNLFEYLSDSQNDAELMFRVLKMTDFSPQTIDQIGSALWQDRHFNLKILKTAPAFFDLLVSKIDPSLMQSREFLLDLFKIDDLKEKEIDLILKQIEPNFLHESKFIIEAFSPSPHESFNADILTGILKINPEIKNNEELLLELFTFLKSKEQSKDFLGHLLSQKQLLNFGKALKQKAAFLAQIQPLLSREVQDF